MFRVVALPAPSDREKTQPYFQRSTQQFHAAASSCSKKGAYDDTASLEGRKFVPERF